MSIAATLGSYFRSPYRAAEISRATKHLPSYAIPARDEMRNGALAILRTRSRYVIKNCSLAGGFVKTVQRRIVGPDYRFQSRLRLDGKSLQSENNALEAVCRRCDRNFTSQGHTLKQAAKIAIHAYLSDGEVFFVQAINPDGSPIAREWQIIHADQVAENVDASALTGIAEGNKVVLGAEMNKWGRVAAWHFFDDGGDVYGVGLSQRKTRRIEASQILHWYDPVFADVPRAVPPLTPVILDIADEEELRKATLTQAWVQACITAFVTSTMPAEEIESLGGEADTDRAGLDIQTLPFDQGMIKYLSQGNRVDFAESKSPGATYGEFIQSVERAQARGLGMSYEKYSGDFRGVSFAGGRLLELDDRMMFRALAADMDEALMLPVYEDRLNFIYDGQKILPKPVTDDLYACLIPHPQPDWVDPLAQSRSDDVGLRNGSKTLQMICEERNIDWADHQAELSEQMDFLNRIGLSIGQLTPAAPEPSASEIAQTREREGQG